MKNPIRRILIATNPYFDVVILQQLELIAQVNSIQIYHFDSAGFSSKYLSISEKNSNLKDSETFAKICQFKKFEYNISIGRQFATALIQDVDLHTNDVCSKSGDNNLSFHENINRSQILWYAVQQFLINNEIDLVMFSRNPQGLNEIVLYEVSKARNIEVLILCQSPLSGRYFSYGSTYDCGNYNKDAEPSTEFLLSSDENLKERKSGQDYCSEFDVSSFFKVLTFLLKVRSINLFNPLYIIRHAKHLHDAPENTIHWKDPFAKFFYCSSTAYFEFLTNQYVDKIDQSRNFVYFPLQPFSELHSEVTDNQFGDQLLALERLAFLLPVDCSIFIKNDPNRNSNCVTPMFFHRVKRILNLVRLPSCIESEQLIDNSIFVATISSEEGWKALSRGKRVLTFGKPWYRKLPGTIEYYEDIEYIEITKTEVSKAEYIRHINCLFSQAHIGNLFPMRTYNTNDFEISKNADRVAETIMELVSDQKKRTFQSETT